MNSVAPQQKMGRINGDDVATTDGSSNSSSNMVPFNISRNVLLALYLTIGALSGSFFFNWSPAQTMYMKNGVYAWVCEDGDEGCLKRLQSINSMMPAGVASTFSFSLIGGISVTSLGPKLTACIGILFQLCGWIVMYMCSERFPAYLASVILMGFGSDPTLYSLLNISSLFPDNRIVVIAAVFGFRSVGNVLPSIFNFAVDKGVSFETGILCYIAILLFCFVTVCLFVPWNLFVTSSPLISTTTTAASPPGSYVSDIEMEQDCSTGEKYYAGSVASLTTLASFQQLDPAYQVSKGFRESRALPTKPDGIPSSDSTFQCSSSRVILPTPGSSVSSTAAQTTEHGRTSPSGSQSLSSSSSPQKMYFPLFPIAAITILTHTYFANSSHEQLESAVLLSTIITPLAFIPAVCFGYFATRFGTRSTMFVVNVLSAIQFLCLIGSNHSEILGWISTTISGIVGSFFIAQFYCFIATNFEEKYFNVLAGILIMCSGIISIIVTPMCDFSSFQQNFLAMNLLCFCATLLNFLFIALSPRVQAWLLP